VNQAIALKLRTLRDIEGVLGSFMVNERGQLLGRDVTAACGSEVLALVGGRLQHLCAAFASADIGGPFESTTLYFPQYKLHIRALGSALLVAVVSAEVNLPALKMAMNMLGRQLQEDFAQLEAAREARMQAERISHVPGERVSQAPADRVSQVAERTSHVPGERVSQPPADRISQVASDRVSTPPAARAADSRDATRPSQEPPRPEPRESGVPPRSYRGTRVAH
jgi:hypothetical protein